MLFCIEPVGTCTACVMKVIKNSAITTVMRNCSTYSRTIVFGGAFELKTTLLAGFVVALGEKLPDSDMGVGKVKRVK